MSVIFADSNRSRMRYVRSNAGWGTIPTSGVTRELRFTGSTINAQKSTAISDEIRADRMIPGVIEVGAKSSGQVNVEFSAGSHDDFLEGFSYGAWTRPMTFDAILGDVLVFHDASTLYANGVNMGDYFFAGRRLRTSGFVNPANNNHWSITSVTWDAPNDRTVFVLGETTAVAEAGNSQSMAEDANDVVVLKNTAIRFGTAGAATIDSNGGNAFAAAAAAGQLNSGQKVFIETLLGLETGTFVFSAAPAAGDQVQVSDGKAIYTFQFGGVVPNGVLPVTLGADGPTNATNLAAALNNARVQGQLSISASVGTGAANATVTVVDLNAVGGSLSAPVNTGAVNTVTQFSGGQVIRGFYTLQAVTADVLTVSPAPPTNANAGAVAVTVKGSMLRNPSNPVPIDYVLETGFEDVNQYFLTDGLRVGGFNLDVASNAIVKGDYTFSGAATTRSGASTLGNAAVYTPLGTTATEVVNATVDVGTILVNGNKLTTAIQSITITGDNSLRDQNAVGYKFPAGIGAGRQDIKGQAKAYFADGAMWDHFINHDTVSIQFDISDGQGHTYWFSLPAVKFDTDNVNPAAGNQDVMEDISYQAFRDPTTDCQFQIDRFSSVHPTTA